MAAETEGKLMSESRQYELMYVIAPTVGDDGIADLHTQVEEIITGEGGQIEKTENMGRRRLAYPISRHKDGTYVLELINGPGQIVRELDRRLKVMDQVLRHLVVRVDDDLRKAERVRSQRQERQQRRRAARGLAPEQTPAPVVDGSTAPASDKPLAAPETAQAEVQE